VTSFDSPALTDCARAVVGPINPHTTIKAVAIRIRVRMTKRTWLSDGCGIHAQSADAICEPRRGPVARSEFGRF